MCNYEQPYKNVAKIKYYIAKNSKQMKTFLITEEVNRIVNVTRHSMAAFSLDNQFDIQL